MIIAAELYMKDYEGLQLFVHIFLCSLIYHDISSHCFSAITLFLLSRMLAVNFKLDYISYFPEVRPRF